MKRHTKVKKVTKINTTVMKGTDNFTALQSWYIANSAVLNGAATVLSTIDSSTIEHTVSKLTETTKVIMDGLTALQSVHPFLGSSFLPPYNSHSP